MELKNICIDDSSFRCLRLCPCMIENRLIYNYNFELNRKKHIGVLFDCVRIICGLDNEMLIHQSEYFKKYVGDIPDNKNGKLTIIFSNRVTYVGDVSDGKLNGYGEIFLGKNLYYKGEFKDNLFHGKGEIFSIFCDHYVGEFFNGYANGNGKISWCTGSSYEGEISKNVIDGYGFYKFGNHLSYKGNFKLGKRSGEGKLTCVLFPDDVVEISGDWSNNIISGKGVITCESKSYQYKGFIQTFDKIGLPNKLYILPHGTGVILNNNEKEKYVGYFEYGMKSGKGNEYYDNGNKKYSGNFQFDRYSGYGEYYNMSGDIVYKGNFHMGFKHGEGTNYYNFDEIEIGNYKYGKKFGKSTYTDSKLNPLTKYYYYNKPVSSKVKDLSELNLSEVDRCPISQNNFKKNDIITKLPKCGHIFHSESLFKWLDQKEECPMCRAENIFEDKIEVNTNKRKIDQVSEVF